MNREVPWTEDAHCDVCGQLGAYDFMGDYICHKCIMLEKESDAGNPDEPIPHAH